MPPRFLYAAAFKIFFILGKTLKRINYIPQVSFPNNLIWLPPNLTIEGKNNEL